MSYHNGKIQELEAELKVLRAQVASIGHVVPGAVALPDTRPDDSEYREELDDAESFSAAMFAIADLYGMNLTNNSERWQDGVFLREIGDFIGDVRSVAEKFLLEDKKAAIWDEGFDAGERDVFEHEIAGFDEPCIQNPYRKETND